MKYDYYAATFPAKPQFIADAITSFFPDADATMKTGKQGYTDSIVWMTGDVANATMYFGGNAGANPHAFATGARAPEFVRNVRKSFPVHYVTRADAAEDFDDETAFDVLTGKLIILADNLDLKVQHVGDFHRAIDGRPINVGSRKSGCVNRVYEKGKQLPECNRPHWVRCELEAHPKGIQRLAAASGEPHELYGLKSWTKRAYEALFDGQVARMLQDPTIPSTDDTSLAYMLKQYGPVMRRQMERVGPVEFFTWLQDSLLFFPSKSV